MAPDSMKPGPSPRTNLGLRRAAPLQDNALMKISRNDPCPCGSGRKYKHCCLARQTPAASSEELAWQRIRREMEGLPERMLRFVAQVYGPGAFDEAWWEFMLWNDDEQAFDGDTPHAPVFLPWMLHGWSPNPDDTDVADTALHEVAPTQAYLQRKGHQLSPALRDYLQSCLDRPFSFYEVERVEPGRSMTLRDLLTGERHDVYERAASQSLSLHEVVYAHLASASGVTLIEAICAVALPPGDKVPVITLRERMHSNDIGLVDPDNPTERLRMWDIELRELYLSLSERYLYPSLPELVTSDGEVLEFHTLVYDIDSAQAAFDALVHLDPADPATLEADIQRDAAGLVQHARIDWVKMNHGMHAESGTLLGTITIDGNRLTAEVKSRERADRLKAIIDDTLATRASLLADTAQTLEQAMAEADSSPPPPLDTPETRTILADYLRDHYEQWIDLPLPALANRTPREMVQSPDGREQVEALLQDAEQHDLGLPAATRKTIFDAIRLQLGLRT
ncbi:SEC-C metal-binding domain-containing protein [Dyella sp. KRB-257]|uniref:SEC-C metal-binding domain-containing protein n=1 Tax=Dyella sp. KRB-257 TaxID=3400915 RepID=UPI003C1109A0